MFNKQDIWKCRQQPESGLPEIVGFVCLQHCTKVNDSMMKSRNYKPLSLLCANQHSRTQLNTKYLVLFCINKMIKRYGINRPPSYKIVQRKYLLSTKMGTQNQ